MKKYTIDDLKHRLLSSRVINERGCWEWTEGTFSNGYGRIGYAGRDWGVHKVSAMLWLEIPLNSTGDIAHKCDNKLCFNPEHLELISRSKNMKDFHDRLKTVDWALGNRNAAKENRIECKNGHPWTEENIAVNSKGYKICKICRDLANRSRAGTLRHPTWRTKT